jgi:hypothetical protein
MLEALVALVALVARGEPEEVGARQRSWPVGLAGLAELEAREELAGREGLPTSQAEVALVLAAVVAAQAELQWST